MAATQLIRFDDFATRVQATPPIRFDVKPELQRFATPGNIIVTAVYMNGRNVVELNSEVQRDVMTGRIMPPVSPENNTYVLYSTSGDKLEVEIIIGDKAMREYCIDELQEYQDVTGLQYSDAFETIPLSELIKGTIEAGARVGNGGFSLRSVVLGQNLTVFRPIEPLSLSPTESDVTMSDL